jgi:hypothetical protein
MSESNTFDIVTDREFAGVIPPIPQQDLDLLEQQILHDGCTDPLIVWKGRGILVDGHNRKIICDKYGLPYNIRELSFSTREEVADWIDARQLGRRNLTPVQMSLLRGRRYNRRKGGHGGDRRSEKSRTQNGLLKTSEQMANECGVGKNTIKRDGQFAAALEKLGAAEEAVQGNIAIPRNDVVQLAKRLGDEPSREQIEQAREQIMRPHISQNSGDNEWYTPEEYIERARQTMGGIDLDPASCLEANKIVRASEFFSREDDGLNHNWRGRVFMNPPYAQPYIQKFTEKLVNHVVAGEVTQAVALVNNATETKWGQLLLKHAAAVCFPAGRVKFWHPDKISAPLQGQMIAYIGANIDAFKKSFNHTGVICHGR